MKFNSNLFDKFESSRLKETYLILGGRKITHHSSDGHCDEIDQMEKSMQLIVDVILILQQAGINQFNRRGFISSDL